MNGRATPQTDWIFIFKRDDIQVLSLTVLCLILFVVVISGGAILSMLGVTFFFMIGLRLGLYNIGAS